MTNTTFQVNPSNRVDFSKIRHITKFQSPASSVSRNYTNTGYTAGNNSGWGALVWTELVLDNILGKINNPNTSAEERAQLVNALNETQKMYEDIRKASQIETPALINEKIRAYQQHIINAYPVLNTMGINNAVTNNRYTYAKNPISGDNAATGWKADGIYGAQTQDRTVLGYNGDWDESGERFQNINSVLNQYGYLFGKGLNGNADYTEAYYINPYTESEPPITEPPITEPPTKETPRPKIGTFETLPKRKRNPWTEPIHLLATLGNNLATNAKDYRLASQMRVPLAEFATQDGIVTNNYALALAQALNAANIRSQAKLNLSSDLTANLGYLSSIEEGINNLANQLAANRTERFNTTSDNLKNIENNNRQSEVATANLNRQQLTAANNALLNAKRTYLATKNAALNDTINKLDASYNIYKTAEDAEDEAYISKLNQYNANQFLQPKLKELLDFQTKGIKGTVFDNWYNQFSNNGDTLGDLNAEALSDPEQVWNYLNAHQDSDEYKALAKMYSDQYDNLYNNYYNEQQRVNQLLLKASITAPVQFSGQGIYGRNGNHSQIIHFSKGGSVKVVKKSERFLDYLKHNQKATEDTKKHAENESKNINIRLKLQLDQLDRETLLLLRSIFK